MSDEQTELTLDERAASNGAAPEPTPEADEPHGYLDAERSIYITKGGYELGLRKVPYLVLERLLNDKSGRPKPPIVEVRIAGKHTSREPDPNDPDFKKALDEWETEYKFRIFRYLFSEGIECDVPAEFAKSHLEFFPNASDSFIQYLWVCVLLEDDENEIAALSDAIMGQTMVTQSGLQDAADSFRRPRKRVSR